jgi:hypothetical protein
MPQYFTSKKRKGKKSAFNDWFRRTTHWLHSSELSLIGRVHIGAGALIYINFIRFGYIAHLSQCGRREIFGYFTRSNYYLPSPRLEEEGGGVAQHPSCGLSLEDMVKTASHVTVSLQKVIRIQMLTLCVYGLFENWTSPVLYTYGKSRTGYREYISLLKR